jgi:predicted DNA-binding transcriptional regulator AlpA
MPKKPQQTKPTKYLRMDAVAERYGVVKRTIKRMAQDGRIPPPKMYQGPYPLWLESELDKSDRKAATRPRPDYRNNHLPNANRHAGAEA